MAVICMYYVFVDPVLCPFFRLVKMIFTCYLFNRNGKRIFYKEYNRTCNAFKGNPDEETKLICGFLLSMNAILEKFSPDK